MNDLTIPMRIISDVAIPMTLVVEMPEPSGQMQAKTNINPTTSSKTIYPDTGYDGLSSVQINAISPVRTSSDLTASGATVFVPAGFYDSAVSKDVASGSATTPATAITANPSLSVDSNGLVTASVSKTQSVTPTVSAGYVASGTAGTVTVLGSNTLQLSVYAVLLTILARTGTGIITIPTVKKIGSASFRTWSTPTALHFIDLEEITGTYTISNSSSIQTIVIEKPVSITGGSETFYGNSKLATVDINLFTGFRNYSFENCTLLTTLILRNTTIQGMTSTNIFNNTPFKSGGAGGTIYIPKVLYDHLGDGTSNDYQAASNWSSIYNRGVITWAKIEGSIYETQYADGTPISS